MKLESVTLGAVTELLIGLDAYGAVLTAARIHADVPTIHDINNRKGARLQTKTEVKHLGFGFFEAMTESGKLTFEGGGALRRAPNGENSDLGWCPLYADPGVLDDLGYDRAAVRAALESIEQRLD